MTQPSFFDRPVTPPQVDPSDYSGHIPEDDNPDDNPTPTGRDQSVIQQLSLSTAYLRQGVAQIAERGKDTITPDESLQLSLAHGMQALLMLTAEIGGTLQEAIERREEKEALEMLGSALGAPGAENGLAGLIAGLFSPQARAEAQANADRESEMADWAGVDATDDYDQHDPNQGGIVPPYVNDASDEWKRQSDAVKANWNHDGHADGMEPGYDDHPDH
jgi:hypothetical protein